jgi:predicted ATPase/DNA-binding SARP family transcriptional activator
VFVRLLGAVGAGPDEHDVRVAPGRIAGAVLAHLVLAGGRTMSVHGVCAAVWDDPPESARNAVQVAVSKLRRTYGSDLVISDQWGYRIRTSQLRVDLVVLESLVDHARDHLAAGRPGEALACAAEAEASIVGEPLAGLNSTASEHVRRRVEDRRSAARLLRGRALLQLGRAEEARGLLQQEVERDGFAEPAHAALMEALRQVGRPGDALTLYEALRNRLADELGADPSPEVAAVFTALLHNSTVLEHPPAARPPHELPPEGSPLLGREQELDTLGASLARGQRLLTLLGPGGVGKTRVAVAAARRWAAETGSAVYFVDLAPARGAADVQTAVAAALRVAIGFISAVLQEPALLVLDSAEHVVDGVAEAVPALLQGDAVRLLVTSKRPLRLREEQQLWIGALSSDPPDWPAVTLLADRAGLSEADRVAQGPDLMALARGAGGMPLVLELLASSLRWEPAASLRGRLAEALPDLQDDARDRPSRHMSVRAAVGWSLGQASPEACRALGALTVFRGVFSSEAATAVLHVALPQSRVRTALIELVNLSLVQRVPNEGGICYHVLDPIKACALESPRVLAPDDPVRQAHAAHYLQWLGSPFPGGGPHEGPKRLLSRESETNLKIALEWLWEEHPDLALNAVRPLLGNRSTDLTHQDPPAGPPATS